MKQGKGIVVEVAARDHVIVMTSQGEFLRVPFSKPVCVGQEIQYTIKRPPFYFKWTVAAVLLLALVGSAGQIADIPGGTTPAFFVTLDINPSIELALNSGQRVVHAEGLNEEGRDLISKIDLVGATFKQAVESIEIQAESEGYLEPGKNEIVVTISQPGIDEYEQVRFNDPSGPDAGADQEIEAVIKETLGTIYHVQMWRVPADAREKIRETGLTPAKYIAVYVDLESASLPESEKAAAGSTTQVTATIERNGDYHYFEFEVTRPVFSSSKFIRTSKE